MQNHSSRCAVSFHRDHIETFLHAHVWHVDRRHWIIADEFDAGAGLRPEEIRGTLLKAVSDAVQEELEVRPPDLSERVVAEFELARRLDERGTAVLIADPAAAAESFARNPWTRFLAGAAPSHWTSVLLHAGAALERSGRRGEALALFESALRSDPGSSLARLLAAEVRLARGELAAGESELGAIPPGRREAVLAELLRRRYRLT